MWPMGLLFFAKMEIIMTIEMGTELDLFKLFSYFVTRSKYTSRDPRTYCRAFGSRADTNCFTTQACRGCDSKTKALTNCVTAAVKFIS